MDRKTALPHEDGNMPELIDRIFFQQLAAMASEDVCNRTACTYDDSERAYSLTLWDRRYRVLPDLMQVGPDDPAVSPLHPYLDLFPNPEPANQ